MPGLAPEFEKKLQLQAKEFKATQPQKGPKEHPEDTMVVRNILVGDDTDVEEVIPYAKSRQSVDPSTGQQHFVNQISTDQFEHVWNTRDFFEVRWDGRPHRIKPGETRRMPRYLANHFAKYLIDFILTQRETKERVVGLLKNRLERSKLLSQIIVGTDSYYNGDTWEYEREGNYVEQQVDKLNDSSPAFDLGKVPDITMGYGLTDKAPVSVPVLEPTVPTAPSTKTREQIIEDKSKNGLLAEARALGLEVSDKMNKDQIYTLIEKF